MITKPVYAIKHNASRMRYKIRTKLGFVVIGIVVFVDVWGIILMVLDYIHQKLLKLIFGIDQPYLSYRI